MNRAGFPTMLKRLQEKDWLHVTLTVKGPVAGGLGLHGSGMFILNPPWTLPKALRTRDALSGQGAGPGRRGGFPPGVGTGVKTRRPAGSPDPVLYSVAGVAPEENVEGGSR